MQSDTDDSFSNDFLSSIEKRMANKNSDNNNNNIERNKNTPSFASPNAKSEIIENKLNQMITDCRQSDPIKHR